MQKVEDAWTEAEDAELARKANRPWKRAWRWANGMALRAYIRLAGGGSRG